MEDKEKVGRFTISGTLAGMNEIIKANRIHFHEGAKQKKTETQRCQWAIIAGSIPHYKNPITMAFRWIEKDLRRDPDNICAGAKFVMDALVELGRIPGDTRRWVKGISHEFPDPDAKNPRIEITITEATNA